MRRVAQHIGERAPLDVQDPRRYGRRDRRVAPALGQERHLAGEPTVPDVGDMLTVASDLEVSVEHDVHLVGEIALPHQDLTRGDRQLGRCPSDDLELASVEVGEQGNLAEVLVVFVLRHRSLLVLRSRATQPCTRYPRRLSAALANTPSVCQSCP